MDALAENLRDWVQKDPSDTRIALALTAHNWDGGMEVLNWILATYDVDKAAVLEIAFVAEFSELYGCNSEDDVIDMLGEEYADNWRLLETIESEWQKGKFRTQHFAPFAEVNRHFFGSDAFFRENRYKPERLPHFTILTEFPSLDPNLPKIHSSDLGEDGKQMKMLAG